MFYKALLTAMALILSSELAAQLFEVVCSGMCDPVSLELKRQIESSVNENLPDADARTYLKGTANANALASAQVGIDHANDVDVFLFGPSLGAGVDVGGYELGDLLSGDVKGKNLRGLGATPSLLLGLNFATLGFKNYKRWKLFLNFGHLNLSPKKTNIRESFIAKSSKPSQVVSSTKHLLQVQMKLIVNGPWLDKLYIPSRNHRSKTDVENVHVHVHVHV